MSPSSPRRIRAISSRKAIVRLRLSELATSSAVCREVMSEKPTNAHIATTTTPTKMMMVRIVVRVPECGGWAEIIDDNRFSFEGLVDRANPPQPGAGGGRPAPIAARKTAVIRATPHAREHEAELFRVKILS